MKVVIQRCKHGSVSVDNKLINEIDNGYVILVGVHVTDTIDDLNYLVRKVLNLRIFDDENGIMNKNIIDAGGKILAISQFTLQAVTREGNRPSWNEAMKGEDAVKLYDLFCEELNKSVPTFKGVFGAEMLVKIDNDGPVTIIIDSKNK